MNFEVHLTFCIIFLFSTWVYFLKCEINELRRRLAESTGEHVEATHEEQLEHAMVAATGLNTEPMAHAHARVADRNHARKADAVSATHRQFQQRSGIPTWTIE